MALKEIIKDAQGVPTGAYRQIAGKGKAEYGASTVRTGTITMGAIDAGDRSSKRVTFDSPMPDGNYLISCTVSSSIKDCLTYNWHSQNADGFQLVVGNASSVNESNVTVIYTAFKLYTDHEYNAVLDSGSCAHGTNEPFMAGQPIRTYLLGLDSSIKFATFTVDPTASTVTDKISTTEYFSYNCYKQGTSWRVVAINSNGNKMYIADVSSSTQTVTWTKLVTESDLTSSVISGSTAPITAGGIYSTFQGQYATMNTSIPNYQSGFCKYVSIGAFIVGSGRIHVSEDTQSAEIVSGLPSNSAIIPVLIYSSTQDADLGYARYEAGSIVVNSLKAGHSRFSFCGLLIGE